MISKLYNFWHLLGSSLWFTPATLCFLYFAFTLGIYKVETLYFLNVDLPNVFFSGGADDAKAVAIALLASMMTMATLAISITIVALSLAASQLGPRLIKTFMADRTTQIFIGLFFGVVVACFMLTMILHDAGPKAINPQITISIVFAMCFANLFVLLGFVNHVAKSIIADNVILDVSSNLIAAVERLTIDKDESQNYMHQKTPSSFPPTPQKNKHSVYFERSGYLQHTDYNKIVSLCEENDIYIEIPFKAGHFIIRQEGGVCIYHNHDISDGLQQEILNCFIIGNTRTATQDIEYSIRHLVEIAIRALSPGINDSFTAITVLDRLSEALAILFKHEVPTPWMKDSHDVVRLKAKQSSEYEIILSAFNQIRYNACKDPAVTHYILEKLHVLSQLTTSKSQKQGLKEVLNDIELSLKYFTDKTHHHVSMKISVEKIHKSLL